MIESSGENPMDLTFEQQFAYKLKSSFVFPHPQLSSRWIIGFKNCLGFLDTASDANNSDMLVTSYSDLQTHFILSEDVKIIGIYFSRIYLIVHFLCLVMFPIDLSFESNGTAFVLLTNRSIDTYSSTNIRLLSSIPIAKPCSRLLVLNYNVENKQMIIITFTEISTSKDEAIIEIVVMNTFTNHSLQSLSVSFPVVDSNRLSAVEDINICTDHWRLNNQVLIIAHK